MRSRTISGHRAMTSALALLAALYVASFSSCEGSSPEDVRTVDSGKDAPVDQDFTEALPDVPPCSVDCGGMLMVPAGVFRMGCVPGEPGMDCAADEKPARDVDVPDFQIDLAEVTVDLWSRCVEAGGCTLPNTSSGKCAFGQAGKGQYPINCITHPQAAAFCHWNGKRLCTESEWEKAAVGTVGTKYPWGNDMPTCARAVLDDGVFGCGTGDTFPIGSKPDGNTPSGLMDMAGNVLEWVADDYRSYDGTPLDGSPWLDPSALFQVARGGAFSDEAPLMRASARHPFNVRLDGYYLGVRCCLSGGI